MKLTFSCSRPLIGIDIQAQELRLIQLRKTYRENVVQQAEVVSLPEGTIVDGKVHQWDVITHKLSKLVQSFKLKNMPAAIILPANLVRMQQMQLPVGLSILAIEEEVKLQIERDFPGLITSLQFDYHAINHSSKGMSEISFVVTRQEYLTHYINCINAAGLQVKYVDVDVAALLRFFMANSLLSRSKNIGDNNDVHDDIHVFFCCVNQNVFLIIFTLNQILSYQQWKLDEKQEILSQLKSQISVCLSVLPNKRINNLFYYNDNNQLHSQLEEISVEWQCRLSILQPYENVKFQLNNGAKITQQTLSAFFMACGAAMREVPVW